jgi:hypothetical protein
LIKPLPVQADSAVIIPTAEATAHILLIVFIARPFSLNELFIRSKELVLDSL